MDANVPWGEDTLFTLEFRADEGGKYALHTCNNKYLSAGGKVSLMPSFFCMLIWNFYDYGHLKVTKDSENLYMYVSIFLALSCPLHIR